jgi:hypothetical protein
LTSVEGGTLTAMMDGGNLVPTNEKGGTSTVTIANVTSVERRDPGGRYGSDA